MCSAQEAKIKLAEGADCWELGEVRLFCYLGGSQGGSSLSNAETKV